MGSNLKPGDPSPDQRVWDCHSHLSFLDSDEIDQLLASSGTLSWVLGGYGPEDWNLQQKIKQKAPDRLITSVGLHPWFLRGSGYQWDSFKADFTQALSAADLIGEVGLDFFVIRDEAEKQQQQFIFEEQLKIGKTKPFIFHIVKAHGAALEILKQYSPRGMVHGFSGSVEVAKQYMAMGLFLSYGPSLLNPQFKKARQAVKETPLECLLIESDAPHTQGESYSLGALQKTYAEVGKIKNKSVQEVEQAVCANMARLLA